MSYLDNIFNFVDYEYLNPSRNAYGNLELVTAATAQVVTTDELKSHLRITTTSENTLLATYILAATQMAEHYCNRHFINARYKITYNDLPDTFSLYYPDVTMSFGSANPNTDDGLFYLSSQISDTYVVLGFSNYILKNSNPYIFCKSSSYSEPTDAIMSKSDLEGNDGPRWKFNFTTGMGTSASDIPDAIKQAIKLIAGDMYYFREDRKRAFPMASEILLQPYKCYL